MTVQELIDELECCNGDAEVRFLAQPSWPFEYTIAAVVEATDQPEDLSSYRETPARRVLLVEGRQACYGDKRAFESAGNEWQPVADRHSAHWQRSVAPGPDSNSRGKRLLVAARRTRQQRRGKEAISDGKAETYEG